MADFRTKPISLPAVPTELPAQQRSFLNAVKAAVDTMVGQRGELDRAVTIRDLEQAGLATRRAQGWDLLSVVSQPGPPGPAGERGPAGSGLPTIGPDDVPPQVTGLTAAGAYANIILSWDDPNWPPGAGTFNIAQFEVYRADTLYPDPPLPAPEHYFGSTRSLVFVDSTGASRTYHYWVRAVASNGNPGDLSEVATATTAPDVPKLLDLLDGQLSEDQLAASLRGRVDSIDGLQAQHTVKVTTDTGYVTGYGLAVTGPTTAPVSAFTVLADKFTIAPVQTDPQAGPYSPFYHLTTPTEINGVTLPPGTYMKAAFIEDAAITRAKIGDLAVDNAKIADATIDMAKISSVNADTITAGYLDAARLRANSITANKLVVQAGAGPVINPDPGIEDPTGWAVTGTAERFSLGQWGKFGRYGWQATTPSEVQGPPCPVQKNKQYRVSGRALRNPGSGASMYLVLFFFDAAGARIGANWNGGMYNYWGLIGQYPPVDSWEQEFTHVFGDGVANYPIPANATHMAVGALLSWDHAGHSAVHGLRITEMVSGELIVNGAVTADKIFTPSLAALSANLGNVTAGTLDLHHSGTPGEWGYVRTANKWWSTGTPDTSANGFVAAFINDPGNESYFFDVTTADGASFIRLGSGYHVGEVATVSFNNGTFLANKDGYVSATNIYARGDIQASSLQAGTAMVGTLNLQGQAVIFPTFNYYEDGYNDMPDGGYTTPTGGSDGW